MNEEASNKPEGTSQPKTNDVSIEGQNVAPPKTHEEVTQDEIDAINREIEEANKKLISEDVSELIKKEKELAKKEAEKEFLVNQKVKDLEAQLLKEQEAKKDAERQTAAQLQALMEKVNALTAAKAVVQNDNPFKNDPQEPPKPTELSNDVADEIEHASYMAFMDSKRYGTEVNKY